MSDDLKVTRDGAVLTVTFNRPARHNAMTYEMYEDLYAACETADADEGVKVLVLRGAGGRAFVSGTDIGSFRDFRSGDDGVAYERRIARVVNRLEEVRVPTVAAVEGYCVGGGLAIAVGLRLARGHALEPVRHADRADARQLSVDEQRFDTRRAPRAGANAGSRAARAAARRRRRRTRRAS